MDSILLAIESFWLEATDIWSGGGWAMWAIAVIAMAIFGMGIHIHLNLRETGFRSVREATWRRWLDYPKERKGPIGKLLRRVADCDTIEDTVERFDQIRTTQTGRFERDLKVMKICVSAAPLVGLLGTVTGMLMTFGALAGGSGGEKTMSQVAEGISEALITTETGLVIALPGLFFQYQLARSYEKYKVFLAHLETVCTQRVHLRVRERQRAALKEAAYQAIARKLQRAVS